MKILHIKDIDASQSQNIEIPVGNFKGLFLESSLVPVEWATGDAGTFNMTLLKNSSPVQNFLIKDMFQLNKPLLGMPTYTVSAGTGTGGDDAITLALAIPFEITEFLNSLTVKMQDNVVLNYNKGNCERGTLSIYGVIQDAAESYLLRYGRLTETGTGLQHFKIPYMNACKLFIEPRAVTDRIQVKVDGILVDSVPGTPLLRATELYGRHETGALTVLEVNLVPSKQLSEAINRSVEISIDHGAAGTTTVHYYALDFGLTPAAGASGAGATLR